MIQGWITTRDLNLATAISTCGVPVIPLSVVEEAGTGRRFTEFHMEHTGHLPAAVIPEQDPHRIRQRFNLHDGPNLPQNMRASDLRTRLTDGTMESADPEHPALDVLMILHARECYRTYMQRGTRYRIQLHERAPRAKLIEGQESAAARIGQPGYQTWQTRDLAIAACMARIGCPVLGIHGVAPHRTFILPRFGYTLSTRHGPEDAQEIAQALISGDLANQCPEHPCVWGYQGIKNRLAIQKHIEAGGAASQVLLYLPGSRNWQQRRRSALVEESAQPKAFDQAIKHLRA